VSEGEGLTKSRRAMAYAGMIAITLVLDGNGRVIADPAILIEGIPQPVHEAIRLAVEDLTRRQKRGDPDETGQKCAARGAAGGTRCVGQEAGHPCGSNWKHESLCLFPFAYAPGVRRSK